MGGTGATVSSDRLLMGSLDGGFAQVLSRGRTAPPPRGLLRAGFWAYPAPAPGSPARQAWQRHRSGCGLYGAVSARYWRAYRSSVAETSAA